MKINLDLSHFPDALLPKILSSNKIKDFLDKSNLYDIDKIKDLKVINFDYPGSLIELEGLLNSILEAESINEYVVTEDTEQENTLTLLKDGDVEQLGIYICDLCGAVFHDEDEKYVHQRAHFLF